ncbi:MAG: response regulator, partial [Edwardsiella sp. (in: enterobacteria)]
MNTPATVYIVDDDASVRDSLGFILEGYGMAVAAYADGNAFLTGADLTLPGCAILDLRMPGLSG